MADESGAIAKMANSLEQVVDLLRQASEERKVFATGLGTRDWKAERESHEQRMEAIRRESEQKYARELEFRSAVLEVMESQLEVLRRIETKMAGNAGSRSKAITRGGERLGNTEVYTVLIA